MRKSNCSNVAKVLEPPMQREILGVVEFQSYWPSHYERVTFRSNAMLVHPYR